MGKKNEFYIPGGDILADLLDFATCQVEAYRVDESAPSITDPHPSWIVRNLLRFGRLAYVPEDDPLAGWYVADSGGFVDRYARPLWVYARTQATDTKVVQLPTVYGEGAACILRANYGARPPYLIMQRYAALVASCDTSLSANVIASMRTQIIGAPKKTVDTVLCMLDDARRGLPVVLEEEQLADLSQLDVSVPFKGIELHELRQSIYAEALRHFGGITPTEYKRERVQSAEVAASVAESIDNVYIMIDTFNEDAELQGVPWRLRYVGEGANYEGGNDDGI